MVDIINTFWQPYRLTSTCTEQQWVMLAHMYTINGNETQDPNSNVVEISGGIIFIACASQFTHDSASHASH
jgi:hypothetical protein